MTQQPEFSIKDSEYQDLDAFVEKNRKAAEIDPCILCGEIHSLRIHAYDDRLVRSNILDDDDDNKKSYQNEKIWIFSIY